MNSLNSLMNELEFVLHDLKVQLIDIEALRPVQT